MLPNTIKVKAKEAVYRIEEGNFTEDDIELLLIRLREYSDKKSIFRELAHFIAHHKRDSGLTFLSLYRVYCRMRAYGEFQYHKKQIDLSKPIEKWFYDFILFQLDELESHILKKKYGFSLKQAKQKFKSFFCEEKDVYKCNKNPDKELVNIINEALGFIKIKPLFSCEEIVNSFFKTFKDLGLVSYSNNFKKQSYKLILCVLVLMHKREFNIGNDVFGTTTVDFPTDGFGKLQNMELRGRLQIPNLADIVVTLIETPIDFENWGENELLLQRETNIEGHFWTVFDKDADLTIGKNSKLYRLCA